MSLLARYWLTWQSRREALPLETRISLDFCLHTALMLGVFLLIELVLASAVASVILVLVTLVLLGMAGALIRGVSNRRITTGFLMLTIVGLLTMVGLSGGRSVAALMALPIVMFVVVLLEPRAIKWLWVMALLLMPLVAVILLQVPWDYPIRFPDIWRQDSVLLASLLLVVYVQQVGRAFRKSIDEASEETHTRARLWKQEGDLALLSEQRFRDFADEAANILWESDRQYRITFLSHGFETLFGIPIESCLGLTPREIYSRHRVEAVDLDHFAEMMTEGQPFKNQTLRWPLRDGRILTALNSGQPYTDAGGRFLGYRGVIRDITDAQAIREQLERRASQDPLTGLFNRRSFVMRLTERLAVAREQGLTLALAFVDLDHFKAVNDTGGHGVGDELLCGIADVLVQAAGSGAEVARIGGDEFCIAWPTAEAEQVLELGEAIVRQVSGYRLLRGGKGYGVGSSVGIAWQDPVSESDVDTWLRIADKAAYRAKQGGRGRVELAEVG